jgi:Holliday junction resolvase RusA-like endonuclease
MNVIQVVIPGPPQGKGRPRVGKVGAHARLFTPPKTLAYESLVAHEASLALDGAPLLQGPVIVSMHLWCQIPKSFTKRERLAIHEGHKRPTTKPDIDNVVKAIFDGFNGTLWGDDVQVVELQVVKHYGETPRVVVNVKEAQ